jgi:hypothetical protein
VKKTIGWLAAGQAEGWKAKPMVAVARALAKSKRRNVLLLVARQRWRSWRRSPRSP